MRQAIETTETHVVKQHCNNQAHLLSRMKDFLLKDHKWHHSLRWIKKENLKKGCNSNGSFTSVSHSNESLCVENTGS